MEHCTCCVDKFRRSLLQPWRRDSVARCKSNQFRFCIFQNTISCNFLIHSPSTRVSPGLTVKVHSRTITNLGIQPLHVDERAQRQRWLLSLCSLCFGELEILVVPHVVMDCRLRKTLGKNKRLFELKTEADVDEAVNVAYARISWDLSLTLPEADHDKYGKACHQQHYRHQPDTSEGPPRTLAR